MSGAPKNQYQNGKIYKIVDNTTKQYFIGSTTSTLYSRLHVSMREYKEYMKTDKRFKGSYLIFLNHDFDIELIENYPCSSTEELEEREAYYIRTTDCINKIINDKTTRFWVNRYKICDCGCEILKKYEQKHILTSVIHKNYLKSLESN
jgi:hypothetical protein